MAKKKNKPKSEFTPDLEMLSHKYSDFYDGFILYDARMINYPVYRTKVSYMATQIQELHPIVLGILKIINYLQKIKTADRYAILAQITQMDPDILAGIIAEFSTKGYLKQETELALTEKGEGALQKENEKIIEARTSYLVFDGVLGTVLAAADSAKEIPLEREADKDVFEFKPDFKARPRTEWLDDEFEGEKTLRQCVTEGIKICVEKSEYVIEEIVSIDPSKFFKKYFCLFYKNADEEEKILVINHQYGIDAESTKLFDRLLSKQKFIDNVNQSAKAFIENKQKFEAATPKVITQVLDNKFDLTEGKVLEVWEHKKYFKHILNAAKEEIYIQSPWIRKEILDIYKTDIENAIKRGVKITVKYGMKPRNRFDKVGIDTDSSEYFKTLDKKFFKLIRSDDHSKLIICDNDFMIMGSFNWLSFGGGRDGEAARGEASTINKNKDEIKKQKEKFC